MPLSVRTAAPWRGDVPLRGGKRLYKFQTGFAPQSSVAALRPGAAMHNQLLGADTQPKAAAARHGLRAAQLQRYASRLAMCKRL